MTLQEGFPDDSKLTPVPNLVFGPLLEELDDLPALKCLLRAFWLHSQKKSFPRFLTRGELVTDRTMARALASERAQLDEALDGALGKLEELGLLIHLRMRQGEGNVDVYMPNTREGRMTSAHVKAKGLGVTVQSPPRQRQAPAAKPNIFVLYEENIGIIGPIMAEILKSAEETYPPPGSRRRFARP